VPNLNDQLPDRLYFRIGEVAALVGVKPYVLRYWEREFRIVKPAKTRSQHRLYRRRDVEALQQIKRLLHEERFTIEGARKHLKRLRQRAREQGRVRNGSRAYRSLLLRVKAEIESLHRMLA
jgi:DNA-binding transcriptional MerR regulator